MLHMACSPATKCQRTPTCRKGWRTYGIVSYTTQYTFMFGLQEWLSGITEQNTVTRKSITYLTNRVQLPSQPLNLACNHDSLWMLTILIRVYSVFFPQVLCISDLGTIEVE